MNKPTQRYASNMKNKLKNNGKQRGGAFASLHGKQGRKAPKTINVMRGIRI